MRKTAILLALLTLPLAGCVGGAGPNPTATCAGVGAVGGAALGSVTENKLAESALVGGTLGLLAGNAGVCG
jgi:hypothetical protein